MSTSTSLPNSAVDGGLKFSPREERRQAVRDAVVRAEAIGLSPILVEKPWGLAGAVIEEHASLPVRAMGVKGSVKIGENWFASAQDLAGTPHESANRVDIGDELSLYELLRAAGPEILGSRAAEVLAAGARGKMESWSVREVRGRVEIITGVKRGVTREAFGRMVREGYFEQELSLEKLKRDLVTSEVAREGQVFIVKPGTLHTIWPVDEASWVVLDELQQGFGSSLLPTLSKTLFVDEVLSLQVHPSDAQVQAEARPEVARRYKEEPTIRVSDFGRGREIQADWTPELVGYGEATCSLTEPITVELNAGARRTYLLANASFAKDQYEVDRGAVMTLGANRSSYRVLHMVRGSGRLIADRATFGLSAGQTLFVPATTGAMTFVADADTVMHSDYVPDLRVLMADLMGRGYAFDEVARLDGVCSVNDFEGVLTN